MTTKNIDLRVGRQGSWIVVAKGAGSNPRELFRLSREEAHSFGERLIEMAQMGEQNGEPQLKETMIIRPKENS